jgi:cellulose synthase/poly-beta-1,6-N-acetylglucosamine synthase-like glycosyltransferase
VKDSTLPYVSVIIPVYNEELVIERRLTNIFETTYPKAKLEVIVIDSGSEDRTRAIILGKFKEKVVLLTENERRGKAHAINLALGNCSGEIVIITDGPALYDKETIFHLVAPFNDPSIGGVSVLYKIQNSNENQITASENAFWSYKEKIRILESKAYSTSWLSGEACAFRHGVINRVSDDTLADDSNIALQLIAKGYRVIVNQNSHFTEKSPSQIDDFFRVKVRRALGGLQEAIRFRSLLFDRRYGCFGLIIFPYRFFSQVLSPIALVAALILLVISAIEVGRYIGIYLLTAIIGAVLIVSMFRFRSMVLAYLYTELVMLTALFLFLNKRMSVRWTQSKTTRL